MSALGLALLLFVGVTLVLTGLPAYAVLILASVIGATIAVLAGTIPLGLLAALPGRLLNLLESDLLQALPLYVLMGVIINRMGVAPALFRTLVWLLPRRTGAPLVAGLGLGALLGPMSGSVGASVLGLSKAVEPQLAAAGVAPPLRQATIALASTLGVVVPPSLVLILLGDGMLTVYTIASNVSGRTDRIINTQDVMRGALVPAAILLVVCIAVAWRAGNRAGRGAATPFRAERPAWRELAVAFATFAFLLFVLGGVAAGYFYAVEAAATGAVMLFAGGVLSGRIGPRTLPAMLTEVMATTGALFAPLLAATTFTLLLRMIGTDKLIEGWLAALPGGEAAAVAIVLAAIFVCAFALDAFEIIFVAVPILIPALLVRVPDAVWVASLLLLTLQASFLLPPIGYAIILTRGMATGASVPAWSVARALAPFLAAQMLVLALVLAFPKLVHLLEKEGSRSRGGAPLTQEQLDQRLQVPVPPFAGGISPFAVPPPALELPSPPKQ